MCCKCHTLCVTTETFSTTEAFLTIFQQPRSQSMNPSVDCNRGRGMRGLESVMQGMVTPGQTTQPRQCRNESFQLLAILSCIDYLRGNDKHKKALWPYCGAWAYIEKSWFHSGSSVRYFTSVWQIRSSPRVLSFLQSARSRCGTWTCSALTTASLQ